MAKYLLEASYTAEGTRGLMKEGGSSRRKLVENMLKKLGGRLETFYFAFGATDVYAIFDVPDVVTATALSLAINQTGAVQIRTHMLITPEEVDVATKTAVEYRPPGK